MSDDAEEEGEDGGQSLIKAEGGITITDIFGIGGAWKSPAAKAVVKAIEHLIRTATDPARTYLKGRAENAVDADAIVSRAKAQAKAALIVAESNDALLERAARRLVKEEEIKQINLEATLSAAVGDLETEAGDVASRSLNDDWLLKWMRGAQYASSEDVRRAWSRALSAQSRADRDEVGAASLSLLESLDQSLAEALAAYVRYLVFFGCVPWHGSVRPAVLDLSKLLILEELGFFTAKSSQAFQFREFGLRFRVGLLGLQMTYTVLELSQRASPLVHAIFGDQPFNGPLQGKEPNEQEAVAELSHLVRMAWEQGPRPISLFVAGPNDEKVQITIAEGTPLEKASASQLLEDIPSSSRVLIAVVDHLVSEYENVVVSIAA